MCSVHGHLSWYHEKKVQQVNPFRGRCGCMVLSGRRLEAVGSEYGVWEYMGHHPVCEPAPLAAEPALPLAGSSLCLFALTPFTPSTACSISLHPEESVLVSHSFPAGPPWMSRDGPNQSIGDGRCPCVWASRPVARLWPEILGFMFGTTGMEQPTQAGKGPWSVLVGLGQPSEKDALAVHPGSIRPPPRLPICIPSDASMEMEGFGLLSLVERCNRQSGANSGCSLNPRSCICKRRHHAQCIRYIVSRWYLFDKG